MAGWRYEVSHGKHDKLTKGFPGLEAADPCPVDDGCSARSDIGETNRRTRRDPAANYCESMHKRCLDRARVHWIVVKKLTGLGILILIVSSMVGFGLHVLLRML
jgi:hypothetical protein